MSQLGIPVTEKFEIGTAEVRVGPLTDAMQLTPTQSIGLIDKVMIDASNVTAKLKGGFPQKTVAQAVVEETLVITATAREYSRRNMRLQLGYGLEASAPTDLAATITASTAPSGNGGTVTTATAGFTAGMLVALYPDGEPENVVLALIASTSGSGPYVLTLDSEFPINAGVIGAGAHIYAARQVPLGGATTVKYFTMMILQQEFSTGRPKVFVVWKASLGGGMKLDTNATDFSSTDMQFEGIFPTGADVAIGGDLNNVADLVSANPYGMFVGGGD